MKSQNSKQAAAEIAVHLSAILRHPETPRDLYNAIAEEICVFSNEMTTPEYTSSPEYIKSVLLASLRKADEETEAEEKTLSSHSLPELLSAAFNHPDMDSDLRIELWETLNNTDRSDIDSPEYIAAILGMKAKNIASRRRVDEQIEKDKETWQAIQDEQTPEPKPKQGELAGIVPHRDRTIFVFHDENNVFDSVIAKTKDLSELRDYLNTHLAKETRGER